MFIKSIVFIAFLFGLVYGDLKQDFPDFDAFLLAQRHNNSLLDPPKELYDQIHKELTQIRTKYPEVKDIHHMPYIFVGKLIVDKGIDLNKLNTSSFGPISVEGIGNDKYLVNFPKPYNYFKLESIVRNEYHKQNATEWSVSSVGAVGTTSHITRSDIFDELMYFFEKGSGDCYSSPFCTHRQNWSFKFNGTEVTLDKKHSNK